MSKKIIACLVGFVLTVGLMVACTPVGNNDDDDNDPQATTFTVTYYNDDVIFDTKTVSEGSKVTAPANPTRDDHNFLYWTLSGEQFDFDTLITQNISLSAEFISHQELVEGPDYLFASITNGVKTEKRLIKRGENIDFSAFAKDRYIVDPSYICLSDLTKNYNFNGIFARQQLISAVDSLDDQPQTILFGEDFAAHEGDESVFFCRIAGTADDYKVEIYTEAYRAGKVDYIVYECRGGKIISQTITIDNGGPRTYYLAIDFEGGDAQVFGTGRLSLAEPISDDYFDRFKVAGLTEVEVQVDYNVTSQYLRVEIKDNGKSDVIAFAKGESLDLSKYGEAGNVELTYEGVYQTDIDLSAHFNETVINQIKSLLTDESQDLWLKSDFSAATYINCKYMIQGDKSEAFVIIEDDFDGNGYDDMLRFRIRGNTVKVLGLTYNNVEYANITYSNNVLKIYTTGPILLENNIITTTLYNSYKIAGKTLYLTVRHTQGE